MTEKLEEMAVRYAEVNQKLSEPDVIADRTLWQELAKEHAFLAEIIAKYEQYKGCSGRLLMPRSCLRWTMRKWPR